MKNRAFVVALAGLLGTASGFHAAAAAPRVSSEPARTPAAAAIAKQWRANAFPSARVSRMQYRELPAARILQVQKHNATRNMKPTQIGVARSALDEVASPVLPALNWVAVANGGAVARLEVTSPLALGIRVGLSVGMLDPRAELRFSGSSDASRIVAVMSGREIQELTDRQGVFWTPATDGQKQHIEVYVPAGVPYQRTRLQTPRLSHLLTNSTRDFKMLEKIGESGSCNVDTACRVDELGAGFVSAKNAVAHMLFTVGSASYICTGTLLNDTVTTSQIPWFYSANHCIENQTVASTLNTYWKYEASACNSGTVVAGGRVQLTGGADYLYSDANTDGLLLRLRNAPPAGSTFAGWDANVLPASSNITGIHHPAGDAKKVSSGQRTGLDADNIEVGWLSGTTEGGSSGSGLFTASAGSYHLRGGLYGGSATCANSGSLANAENRDYYSRFDVVFPQIRQYLAPPTNNPPVANFTYTVNGKTISFTDTSTDAGGSIASRSWTFGDGSSSTAANPVRTYATLGVYAVTLTVTDNGGLTHSISRSVSTIGRQRINGSQPRIPRSGASAVSAGSRARTAPRIGQARPMGPFEP